MGTLMLLLLAASTAHAVPGQFTHQGRLLDSDGAPLEGEIVAIFRLMDADIGGAILWEEPMPLTLTNGFYASVLGADEEGNPLDVGVLDQAPLWLEIQLEDAPAMYPRQPIHSVPYATMAGVAEELSGGPVDASEIAVDGETIIDAGGTWVGSPPVVSWSDLTDRPADLADGTDADSLADLSCLDGDHPNWNALLGEWDCALDEDTLADLTCTDGQMAKWSDAISDWGCGYDVDTQLSVDEVRGYVTVEAIDLAEGSTVGGLVPLAAGDPVDWLDLIGVPGGLITDHDAAFFGDGSDGDATISGTTEVDRAMQYANLTIEAAGTLRSSSSSNASLMIFVRDTLTIDGRIDMDGRGGPAGEGGPGGNGGGYTCCPRPAAEAGTPGTQGGRGFGHGLSGGDANAGGSGGGAHWGTYPGASGGVFGPGAVSGNDRRKAIPRYAASALPELYGSGGSGGNGGGGAGHSSRSGVSGGNGGDGGDGGNGGGGIIISAKNIVVNPGGVITADGTGGSDAADGTNGSSGIHDGESFGSGGGGGGAGGGGGESGTLILIYTALDNRGTISSSGGPGGAGGEGGIRGSATYDGSDGSDGPTGDIGDSNSIIMLDVSIPE